MKQKTHAGAVTIGPCGSATEVILDPPLVHDDWAACVSSWLLHCPGQSFGWDHYFLSIIQLRPIEGVRPAVIAFPGATHEVMLVALDSLRHPVPEDIDSWHLLLPLNVEEQVELPYDSDARDLLAVCASAVVNGILPAEPALAGAVEPWRSALIKTSAHYRGEPHAP